jgi:hypothetical protein
MFAAPILIDRLMTNYSAGVSGNGNRIKSKDGGQIQRQTDIYHHSPRPISIMCHLPDPPHFSLPTTFKDVFSIIFFFS